jgi:hypothetical protein
LLQFDPESTFPTKSKAKKACQRGAILILRSSSNNKEFFRYLENEKYGERGVLTLIYKELLSSSLIIGDAPAVLMEAKDQVWMIHARLANQTYGYPVSVTKYTLPPVTITKLNSDIIVYQDDHL